MESVFLPLQQTNINKKKVFGTKKSVTFKDNDLTNFQLLNTFLLITARKSCVFVWTVVLEQKLWTYPLRRVHVCPTGFMRLQCISEHLFLITYYCKTGYHTLLVYVALQIVAFVSVQEHFVYFGVLVYMCEFYGQLQYSGVDLLQMILIHFKVQFANHFYQAQSILYGPNLQIKFLTTLPLNLL